MPLNLAVSLIFRRVYEERLHVGVPGRSTVHLDGLAYVVAEYTQIYTYAQNGNSARALTKEELAGGLFQNGAKTLNYVDGRATINELAVSAKVVEPIVVALITAGNTDEAP
jgi:hypothetical protein